MRQKDLEARAVLAHRQGTSWATFWETVRCDVAAAEPFSAQRYRRLVRRLLGLCVAGDDHDAVHDEPDWELDDQAEQPDDVVTHARLQWRPNKPG